MFCRRMERMLDDDLCTNMLYEAKLLKNCSLKTSFGVINDKQGNPVTEEEHILNRWKEYC